MKNETTEKTENKAPKYWLSLDQWRNDPDFQELAQREFMSSPMADEIEQEEAAQGGWARREFLKLMGASIALTSFGCVRRPVQKIVPFAKRPKEIVPGLPNYYASTFVDGGDVTGLVVKTREGRPIKLEGNEFYPGIGEALSTRGQAFVLSLYDPDRLTSPVHNLVNKARTNRDTLSLTWAQAETALKDAVAGSGVYVLSGSNASPTSRKLISEFVQKGGGKYFEYEPIDYSSYLASQKRVHDKSEGVPYADFTKADVIVGIDVDYLGVGPHSMEYQREFANRRFPDANMNYSVQFETMLSVTGMNADQRYPIRPSQQVPLAMVLTHKVCQKLGLSYPQVWRDLLTSFKDILAELKISDAQLDQLAERLVTSRGRSVVMTGGLTSLTQNQSTLFDVVNYLNGILGNDGKVIKYSSPSLSYRGSVSAITELMADIDAGKVNALVIHKTNPLYYLPNVNEFREALAKVKTVFYTGDRNDETGSVCDYIIPDHHDLEKWADAEGVKGIYSIQQPTIQPLYDTKAFEDVLLGALGNDSDWYTYLKKSVQSKVGNTEQAWVDFLQKGVVGKKDLSASGSRSYKATEQKGFQLDQSPEFELVLYPTVGIKDGTLANVSWLQEFPDPVTKICWDNYVSMSIKTAEQLKVREGQIVELSVDGKTLKVPAHIQVGLEDKVLALAIGYGRKDAGQVATGVGVNAYNLAKLKNDKVIYSGLNATVKTTSKMYDLANVQGHHSMEGRQIVVEATLKDIMKDPTAGRHKHKVFSLWSEHKYKGHKWGMAVDLSRCNGCGSCIVACQAENNIPVVGKKHILNGREMSWIRVDRYYTGSPENPDVVFQPIMCMHCDNAPCETVCPVIATAHSDEGLNDMAYNRCVGTRYCANNCPYKVRRFNWFNYSKVENPLKMVLNPEVTVRTRGVMEKCSFCVQRIHAKKTEVKLADRKIEDGDIKTACQQTCPTKALVFGDLNDPNSEVGKMHRNLRSYSLLEELAVYPAVKFLSKVRNVDELKTASHDQSNKKGGHH